MRKILGKAISYIVLPFTTTLHALTSREHTHSGYDGQVRDVYDEWPIIKQLRHTPHFKSVIPAQSEVLPLQVGAFVHPMSSLKLTVGASLRLTVYEPCVQISAIPMIIPILYDIRFSLGVLNGYG